MKQKIIATLLLAITFNALAADDSEQPVNNATTLSPQSAQNSSAELAKKLANPIADLVSAQTQYNWYQNAGANRDGHMQEVIFQPVLPFSLTPDYNLIVRPVITGTQLTSVDGISNSGLSPTVLETFFTKNTNSNLIWGVGPFLQAPSNAQPYLGSQQWGGGASAILVYRPGHWTMGTLAYQSFDLGGPGTGGTAGAEFTHVTIVADGKNMQYYIRSFNSMQVQKIDLKKVDFTGKSIKYGDLLKGTNYTDVTLK